MTEMHSSTADPCSTEFRTRETVARAMVPQLTAWAVRPPPPSPRAMRRRCVVRACARNADASEDEPPPTAAPSPAPTPLLDALQHEAQRVRGNFFFPGHKQGAAALPAWRAAVGPALALDLPELPSLDNLYAPEGVLEEAQALAADTFTPGSAAGWHTFFLVNGSTCGVHAAVLAAVRPGRKILLPRNAHQSAVHALVLSGAVPVWIEPLYDAENDLLHGIAASSVAEALAANPGEVDAVLLISPTYHGACSDVATIAALAHDYGALLIVDEAHGSHLAFHDLLPAPASECGADMVVQSTHKTLSALAQAAMLHVHGATVERKKVASVLQVIQSSSPSNLLLASLEAARGLMDEQGEDLMSRTIDLARSCAVRIASLEGYSVLGVEDVGLIGEDNGAGETHFMHDLDPTRVTVLLPGGVTGYDIDTHLIDRFGIFCELPSFKHITFVFTPGNTRAEVDRLVTALALFEATSHKGMPDMKVTKNKAKGRCSVFGQQIGVTPRAAFFARAETVSADAAVGRICAETLCPYPPGVPVLFAGERITQECIDTLRRVLDAGGSVSGASDESLSTVRVVADEAELGINSG